MNINVRNRKKCRRYHKNRIGNIKTEMKKEITISGRRNLSVPKLERTRNKLM